MLNSRKLSESNDEEQAHTSFVIQGSVIPSSFVIAHDLAPVW